MTKEITEVVYSLHFTEAEFKKFSKIAEKKNETLDFYNDELLKIKNVTGVTSFAWCQHSIHIQIQAENGQGFSNTAQSCYSKLKNLIG